MVVPYTVEEREDRLWKATFLSIKPIILLFCTSCLPILCLKVCLLCKPFIFSSCSVYGTLACISCFKCFWWLWKDFGFTDIGKVNALYPYFVIGGRHIERLSGHKLMVQWSFISIKLSQTFPDKRMGQWRGGGRGWSFLSNESSKSWSPATLWVLKTT